ncbi:MAG: hypothetical protein HC769_34265 [Cyanobacteria bacterium CRU_2_1]|nr:hypothetical protein [Cyanobacteria bacterium CRU_2_1]
MLLRGRISEDSRRFAPELLQYLAFTMIQGDPHSDPCKPTPPWLTVPKTKAEQILAVFLAGGREPDWETKAKAKEWLEDLLEHHLLQLANDPDKIEFHHQLFQEYYASEWLLLKLPALSDEQLKYYFLNYLKWTEAIGLMMGSSDESQAMRVVKLALDIDLRLGARLAGEVKLRDQEKTFELVDSLVTPSWLKVKLLSETRSDFAIPPLQRFLKNSDASIRFDAVEGFKNIGSKDAANSLVAALEDEEINWTVAEALSQIGSREIIPALLKFLKHEQPNVRMAVVEVLGKTNGEGIILGLLEALEDEHEDVRYGAIKALRDRAEADTTPNLINALEDTEYSVRKLAAQALGNIRHEMAISSLLKVALQDEDKEVREAASEALKKIGAEAFISDAIKALKEDNKLQVRFNAIDLAKRLKYKGFVSELLLITLEDKEDEIRRQAAFALGAIEDEAAIKGLLQVALEKHWRVKSKFFVCQPRAIEALGRIKDKRAVSGLIELLGNCRSSTRWRAAKALGEIKDESAVLALINALEDEHIDIRIMAAEALGKIGDKRAIPGLLEMLNDENPDVCREAVDAFYRKLTCKESLPGLISALEKVDPNDRYLVVMALDKIGDKASVPVLIRILKEDKGNDKMLCRYAAEALGKIKDRTAIPALLKILELEHNKARFSSLNSGKPENYEDPNFFSFILYVLQQFQDLKVLSCFHEALAHPNAEIREDAAGMLRSFASHESIPFLVKAIQDAEPGVRAKAALTLAAIGGKVAGRAILKLLEEEEEDYVRGEIAEWIPMQHRELALSILNKAIDDIDYSVRYHAVRGAKRLSGEDTIPLLLKAIQDLDEMPRREAVSALSNLEADCSSKVLPRLTTLISNHSGQEAFQAIVNIQKKCQFYNYDIAKSPPPPAVNQTSGAGNQGQTIFNIGTFNANNSNLNLGGTIQGDQLINQPHKSES